MPKVSIIIPTYNREKFIGQAILSILEQSFTDFEIIVVDDGSTDNTKNIIEAFDDPRMQYYYQENKGRSVARNYALLLAKGKYITFLDSDDIYLPNKLELQVNYLDLHSDISMIYTSANCIDDNGNFLQHKYEASTSGWIYKDIAFFIPVTITLPTVMVRREVFDSVGYFDEKMHRFEDTDMWRRISKLYQIMAIPIYTCNLRTHKDNHLINQDPKVIESSLRYYSKKIMNEDQEFDLHLRKSGISEMYNHYGYAMLGIEQFRETGNKMIAIAKQFHNPPPPLRNCAFKCVKKLFPTFVRSKIKNILYIIGWMKTTKQEKLDIKNNLKNKFTEIYDKNLFRGSISRSGAGSDLLQTKIIRAEIPKIIKEFKIKTFLDAPCGDWYWMKETALEVEQYIGTDIVDSLIQKNQQQFANSRTIFKVLNLTKDALPKADLIFSRDLFVHLNYEDIFKIIANFKKSGATYLLTTTFTNRTKNNDLVGIDSFWRALNLQCTPFNFPAPILLINEQCSEENGLYSDKNLGLWVLKDIKLPIK